MKRDLRKYIAEYENKFGKTNNAKGAFYCSDVFQIKEISEDGADTLFNAISNGLMAGFMIGYRLGKKAGRKK